MRKPVVLLDVDGVLSNMANEMLKIASRLFGHNPDPAGADLLAIFSHPDQAAAWAEQSYGSGKTVIREVVLSGYHVVNRSPEVKLGG